MTLLNYFISALAVASSVHAQCSTKGTLTITNTAQASSLASCQTFSGSIAVQTKFVGDLALDGPKKITGNLVAHNVNKLTSLSAMYLQEIEGTWEMISVPALGTLTFPALGAVNTIEWFNIGQGLTTLDFSSSVTQLETLKISGTFLTSLEGLSPVTAQNININANSFLQNVTMQLTDVKGSLIIQGNLPPGTAVTSDTQTVSVSMPKLKSAGSVIISSASDISLPALVDTTSAVSFYQNSITSLDLPKLLTANAVSVSGNPSLHSLSMPVFKNSTGTFNIENNTGLHGTLSFPALTVVKGSPNFFGVFDGLSIPKLAHVEGGMNITSTKDITKVCKHFESLKGPVISAAVNCKGAVANAHTSPNKSPNSGSNSGSSSGSSGGSSAATNIQISIAFVFGAVVTIATFLV